MKSLTVFLAAGLLAAASARAADTYDIHVITSLTGQAAFLGAGEKLSTELVEKAINDGGGVRGKKLHFIISDDGSNPQTAVQLADEFFAAKPAVLIGPSLTSTCRAVAPLIHDGPVMYCFSPLLAPPDKSYAFTVEHSALSINMAAIRFFRLSGRKRIAFLFNTDASGQGNEMAVRKALALPENRDVTAVAMEHFASGDVSVAAQLANIKAANPQALSVLTTGTPLATVFRGIVQAGLEIPIETGDGSMTYAQMRQYHDFLPKDLYIPSSEWVVRDPNLVEQGVAPKIEQFYRYFAAAGVKPDLPMTHGWEVGLLVSGALQKLGLGATATQLRDYLEHLQGFPGIYGVYDFIKKDTNRGLDISNTIVTRWSVDAGTWLPVSRPGGYPIKVQP